MKAPADLFRFGLLTTSLLVAGVVSANELETTLTVTLDYDDNIFRDRDNEVADLKRTPSLDINYKYDFTSVSAELGYSVRRVDYRDDSFPDRTDFIGQGNLNWSIIDNRLSWVIEHNRNRVSIDNQEAQTPQNEDDRTVVRTGPTIKLLSSNRSELSVNAFYAESNAEETQDTEVVNVGVNYTQRLTDTFSLGLFAEVSEIKPEVEAQGYDNDRAGIRFARTSENLNILLEYGKNEVARVSGDENSGPYYSASLIWVTTNGEFSFRANRELTDSSLGLSLNQNVDNGLDNGDGNLGNQDVVDRFHHELSYSHKFQKARFSLGLTYDEQDFQSLMQDESSEAVRFSFGYDVSRRVSVSYDYNTKKNEFFSGMDQKGEFTSELHSLSLQYRINDALSLRFLLKEESREYEQLVVRDYDAAAALMTISYRL